jgi:hypothetical protein
MVLAEIKIEGFNVPTTIPAISRGGRHSRPDDSTTLNVAALVSVALLA